MQSTTKSINSLKRYSHIKLNKESFDKYPQHSFLRAFHKLQIAKTNLELLAYIISKDIYSFKFLPIERQDEVCNAIANSEPSGKILDTSFFTTETLDQLSYYSVNFDKGIFARYFGHIPLYVLFNRDKKQYTKYNINFGYNSSDMGIGGLSGHHTFKLRNPIVWNIQQFINHTELKPRFISRIKLDRNSSVIKTTSNYFEVDNFDKLKLGTIRDFRNICKE